MIVYITVTVSVVKRCWQRVVVDNIQIVVTESIKY